MNTPTVIVAVIGGALTLLVVGCIAVAVRDGVRAKRKEADLARDRQARDDKAVRTWMDSEDAA